MLHIARMHSRATRQFLKENAALPDLLNNLNLCLGCNTGGRALHPLALRKVRELDGRAAVAD